MITGTFHGAGTFGSTTLISNGNQDVFVMHLTSAGVIDWAIRAGGVSSDEGYSIASDGAGGTLVTGSFRNTVPTERLSNFRDHKSV